MQDNTWWWQRAFVYVGRISAYKGVPQIIEAWCRLAETAECPPLWLVGGAPHEIQAMRQYVGAHRVSAVEASGKLVWWGYLDSAGISAILTRALALVTHSRYEPGGRVILEAMSEGVPVIATPHGFARDLVRDWHSGFLVPFDSVGRLERCMAHFLNQPLLRPVLGETARSEAAEALDEWRFTRTHFEVYEAAAADGRLPARVPPPHRATPRPGFRRRLPPQYPFLEREPSAELVKTFFRKVVGTESTACRQLSEHSDSSVLWHLEGGGHRWVVKWSASRLESRPLWDPLRKRPLFRSGRDRFRSELLAADLPGFSSAHAADETHCLLLRPWLSAAGQVGCDESFRTAGALYQRLYSHQPEAPWLEEVDRDWSEASRAELEAACTHCDTAARASCVPWDTSRHSSSRLARRNLELLLLPTNRPPPLPESIIAQARDSLRALVEVTKVEQSLPAVVCHGSAGWRHVALAASGDPVLLDGEHVHPGWPGEDFAALLLDAIPAGIPPEMIAERLERYLPLLVPDSGQASVTRAWLGLLVLEDLVRVSVMDLSDDSVECLRRWEAVRKLISQLTR